MKFKIWTKEMGIRAAGLMSILECSPIKAHRIFKGVRRPQTEDYRRLFLHSKGAVTPNSFYPIEDWEKQLTKTKSRRKPTAIGK